MKEPQEVKNRYSFIQEDKRVLERNLRRHLITAQEHQRLLKSLKDEAEAGEEQKVFSEKGK